MSGLESLCPIVVTLQKPGGKPVTFNLDEGAYDDLIRVAKGDYANGRASLLFNLDRLYRDING